MLSNTQSINTGPSGHVDRRRKTMQRSKTAPLTISKKDSRLQQESTPAEASLKCQRMSQVVAWRQLLQLGNDLEQEYTVRINGDDGYDIDGLIDELANQRRAREAEIKEAFLKGLKEAKQVSGLANL